MSALYKIGERVWMNFYGAKRYGVVSRAQSSGIVWVKWNVTQREGWTHAESLHRLSAGD